ncbi:MAG: glycoside hydrolase family 105 protein [Saprospiraceae bacterium]
MKKYSFLFTVLFLFSLSACKTTTKLNNDSIETSMVKALQWQEANPIFAKAPTDWTNGAYYTGVVRAHKTTQNPTFLKALKDMGKRNDWQTWERFYHADDVTISYAYAYLATLGEKEVNLAPTRQFIDDHFNKPHAWKDGTAKQPEKKILWWWCDALFMAPPVIALLAQHEGTEDKYLDEIYHYYKETYDLLYDQEENLFARDTRYQWTGSTSDKKEPNGNKIFWSRGNGWVLGGLALMLDALPANYKHRPFYEQIFKKMASKIAEIQPQDGLWRTSLLAPEAYDHGEVSGSGFYTFALTWGINNGLLDKAKYRPVVLKAWKALEKCQQANGKVGWVQNIGAEPKPATKDSWQNYGTGAFLLAGSEILKLK